MLSSAERTPRPTKPPVMHDTALGLYGNLAHFPIDIVTISKFPHRAPHVKLQQSVKPATNLNSTGPTNDRTKRIMREVGFFLVAVQLSVLVLIDCVVVESAYSGPASAD